MNWLSSRSFSQILLLAISWPLLLAVIALVQTVAIVVPMVHRSLGFGIAIAGVSRSFYFVVLGPPTVLLLVWAISRRPWHMS